MRLPGDAANMCQKTKQNVMQHDMTIGALNIGSDEDN